MGKAIDVSLLGGVDSGRVPPMSWFSNFVTPLTENNKTEIRNFRTARANYKRQFRHQNI